MMVETYRACLECDLLHEVADMHSGDIGFCRRCGAALFRKLNHSLDYALVFALTGLAFFVVANFFPILVFELNGNTESNRLIDGAIEFLNSGYGLLGILVLFSSIVAPFLVLVLMISILLPLKLHKIPVFAEEQIRFLVHLRPWAMAEVFVIGIMVAFVKLGDFADVSLGVSVFAFILTVLSTLMSYATLDMKELWYRLGELKKHV